ncbi:M20 family metallopeptidase [Shouchella clausii]|uniref:M20 family metallopeptidase n=1 Tax=Shouchella clausii TaxID=79880 RepID=UPI000BA719C6|nr:M20 family metallopeptidase [Shouchella clausii]MCM3311738.1 M20 family metallopeptidase [Psychrobacillus sp. MER TA 17]PAE92677.1 carboxypeptidase [Shouchella clausii]
MGTYSKANMLDLLEKLVNIDSGSYDKEGIDRVGSFLYEQYKALGFSAVIHEQSTYGNHMTITHQEARDPTILLLCHLDTVFPTGTAAKRPFSIKGNRAYGPGVVDMKASHVSLLSAVSALAANHDSALQNIAVLLTSDEEIGAPSGRKIIEAEAKGKKAVLVMEPARKDGSLVTARRGGGTYVMKVNGKAAHAGIEPENGRSAIEELAHKIVALHGLSDQKAGTNVNVGLIKGGTSVNTIADYAEASIDIRISKLEQAAVLEKKIQSICETPTVEGTAIELIGGITRPPMERNEQTVDLFNVIQKEAQALDLTLTETATGGGSDASFTSALGVATIDGMGPVGGNPHSEEEYVEIDSLQERSLLLERTLVRLSK